MSAQQPVHFLILNLAGAMLVQVDLVENGDTDGVKNALAELARHRDAYPLRSSLIVIINGRIVSVISADQVFNSPSPSRMQAAADLMGYRISMAQHVFELRRSTDHKMIPPPLTYQKLSFGADTDKANIAVASLISRVQLIIVDEKGENITSAEDAAALLEAEIEHTAYVFPEVSDAAIIDQIHLEFANR